MFVRLLVLLCLLLNCVLALEKPTRAKRFAAFGSLSTVGGRVGCVVSQGKLFINGHFNKDLSEDEQQAFEKYQEELAEFKEDVAKYLEQRQAQLAKQSGGRTEREVDTNQAPLKKPEPPKKPSFCSDKATTQYVFDGCSVQGDNLFIGDQFVRKLNPDEQQKLEQFDRQFTAYQKAITADFRKKVQAAFGEHFGSMFGLNGAPGGGTTAPSSSEQQQRGSGESGGASGNGTAPEAPKTPSFCTLIV